MADHGDHNHTGTGMNDAGTENSGAGGTDPGKCTIDGKEYMLRHDGTWTGGGRRGRHRTRKHRSRRHHGRRHKRRSRRYGLGSKSKTHRGDMDFTTKRGNKDFHHRHHDVKKSRRPYRKRRRSRKARGAYSLF